MGHATANRLPYRWAQRLVRKVPPLRRLFWVPEGCFADIQALAATAAAGRELALTQIATPAAADPIGDAEGGEPLFVARLHPGKLVGDCLLVATPDDFVVGKLQALHGVEAPADHWVMRRCRYRRQAHLAGTTALLAVGSSANYYHWLFESLPRLHLLTLAGFDWNQIDQFLLSETQPPFQAQSLDLLGIPPRQRRRSQKARVLECDSLLVPSAPAPAMVFPSWVLAFLRRNFLPAAEAVPPGQRLFISRRRAPRRRLANEEEVEACLRRAGFTTVCLEDCSFARQVGLFAAASAIVAVHGAGLANLAFASRGAQVVELVAPTFVNHCYLNLARAMRLSYREVVGTLAGPPGKRPEADDLRISPADLQRALGAS